MHLEHSKLAISIQEANAIGDFLQWLEERGIRLARPHGQFSELMPIGESKDALLYAYLDIDPIKLEQEKRDMLDHLRMVSSGLQNRQKDGNPKTRVSVERLAPFWQSDTMAQRLEQVGETTEILAAVRKFVENSVFSHKLDEHFGLRRAPFDQWWTPSISDFCAPTQTAFGSPSA